MNEQRKCQPAHANAAAHEIAHHHANSKMLGALRDQRGVGTPSALSQTARCFGVFTHCLADRSGFATRGLRR